MPKPLIPDDVRALYEELIDEGSRIIPDDDPQWSDPRIAGLLDAGLAFIVHRQPPVLTPVGPDAAFENMFARWARPIALWQHRFHHALGTSARLHHSSLRATLQRGLGAQPVVFISSPQVPSLQGSLSNAAKSIIRSLNTGPYGEPKTLPTGEPHLVGDAYFAADRDFRAYGGRFLILCDGAYAAEFPNDLVEGHAAGEELRIAPKTLPMKLLVVDDHTVLVPLGPYGKPCLLVRDSDLVALFTELFDKLWDQSDPWSHGTSASTKESSTRRDVLSGLAAGLKDDAIARHLGVSARTVRRHVAQIMQDLGTTTRFAAGVAAVRQGLVAKGAA